MRITGLFEFILVVLIACIVSRGLRSAVRRFSSVSSTASALCPSQQRSSSLVIESLMVMLIASVLFAMAAAIIALRAA